MSGRAFRWVKWETDTILRLKVGGEVGINDKRSPCGIGRSGKREFILYIIIYLLFMF